MKYLGIKPNKPKVAVFDFTGCEGCAGLAGEAACDGT